MTKGIQNSKKSGRDVYPDIIDLPHHQSKAHPHMSLYDRAAQFSPFAALSGYDDMITEEGRETGTRQEQELDKLNMKLSYMASKLDLGEHPHLSFTVFVPDTKKEGGRYEEIEGTVKKVDLYSQTVTLFSGSKKSAEHAEKIIEIQNILDIHGELVDYLDEEIL